MAESIALRLRVKVDKGTARTLDVLESDLEQVNRQLKEARKLGQTDLYGKLKTQQTLLRNEAAKTRAEIRGQIRDFKNAKFPADSINGLRLQYKKLRAEINGISQSDPRFDKLIKSAENVKGQIITLDQRMKDGRSNVGRYQTAFQGLGAGLVRFAGVAGLAIGGASALQNSFRNGIRSITEYGNGLADLSAITGVSGADLVGLEVVARDLTNVLVSGGQEVRKASSEIFESLKLVASAKPELLENQEALAAVTKEVIVLSKASGDDLATSTNNLTTVLNQFQRPAEESKDIINQLAAGSKFGASSITDTAAAIKTFGTQAALSNVSTAQSVGLVQTLAERQLKAGEAGTKLRNILTRLSEVDIIPRRALDELESAGVNLDVLRDKSSTLEEKLRELQKAQGNGAGIARAFGTENAAAANILIGNVEKFERFTRAVQGTNIAYDQAATRSDTLGGDFEKLGIALEQLSVAFFSLGTGAIRDAVQGFTSFVDLVKSYVEIPLPSALEQEQTRLNAITAELTASNTSQERRNDLILILQSEYPSFLKNQEAEEVNNKNIRERLQEINEQYRARILLQELQQQVETAQINLNEKTQKQSRRQIQFFNILGQAQADLGAGAVQYNDALVEELETINSLNLAASQRLGGSAALSERQQQLENLARAYGNLSFSERNALQAEQELSAAQDQSESTLQRIREAYPELAAALDETTAGKEKEKEKTDELTEAELALLEAKRKAAASSPLENANEGTNVQRQSDIQSAISGDVAPTELAQRIKDINARADIEIQQNRLRFAKLSASERLKIENDIQLERIKLSREAQEELVQNETDKINAERNIQIQIANNTITNRQELNQRIKEINLQADIDILQQRIDQYQEGADKRIELENEYFAKLTALNLTQAQRERKRTEDIINENRDKRLAAAEARGASENELLLIRQQAERSALEAQLESEALVGEERKKILAELEKLEKDSVKTLVNFRKEQARNDVNNSIISLQDQLAKGLITEQQFNERRKELERQLQIDLINIELNAANITHARELELIKERGELERGEITKTKDWRKLTNEEIAREVLTAASTVAGAVFQIEQNRIAQTESQEIDALEERTAARLEAAEGNAEEQTRIREQAAAERLRIEEAAARRRQQLALKEAIARAALAAIGALFPFNPVALAQALLTGAANIAVIKSQQFASGGQVLDDSQANLRPVEMNRGRGGRVPNIRNIPLQSNGDTTLATLRVGEAVLNEDQQKRLMSVAGKNIFRQIGVPGFITGGVVGATATPQVINPNRLARTVEGQSQGGGVSSAQLQSFAQMIANQTAAATAKAIKSGLNEYSKDQARLKQLQKEKNS